MCVCVYVRSCRGVANLCVWKKWDGEARQIPRLGFSHLLIYHRQNVDHTAKGN